MLSWVMEIWMVGIWDFPMVWETEEKENVFYSPKSLGTFPNISHRQSLITVVILTSLDI